MFNRSLKIKSDLAPTMESLKQQNSDNQTVPVG